MKGYRVGTVSQVVTNASGASQMIYLDFFFHKMHEITDIDFTIDKSFSIDKKHYENVSSHERTPTLNYQCIKKEKDAIAYFLVVVEKAVNRCNECSYPKNTIEKYEEILDIAKEKYPEILV